MSDDELERGAKERIGATLNGKYRLDALIGVGGMAVVYRATHRNQAQLAVKMLHPALSHHPGIRARFLREGYAANSVKHPGAVLVTDDDVTEDGVAFLVMELLEGASLEDVWLRLSRRMPVSLAVDVGRQLLDVLSAAHEAGIVHRDIKPANLFLTRDGTLKVLDFGIARVRDAGAAGGGATGTGMPIGTPAFMAPEQALARSAEIGPRTDVWAAGATLFTLLSGQLVHAAPTPTETLVQAATRPAPPLGSVASHVPEAVARVVDRALAFDAGERWRSARDMGDALAAAWGQAPTEEPSKASLAALFTSKRSGHAPAPSRPFVADLANAPTLEAGAVGDAARVDAPPPVAHTRGAAAPASRPPTAWLALPALVLLVGALLLWARHRADSGAPEAAARPPRSAPPSEPAKGGPILVLVSSFENLSPDPDLDGTADVILESALSRSAVIDPFTGRALRALAADLSTGAAGGDETLTRLVADKTHDRVVLVHGSIAPRGSGYAVSLKATDVTGAVLTELQRACVGASTFVPAVAHLACDLRAALGDVPCDEASAERCGLSDSVEAVHELSIGRAASASNRPAEAIQHFRRALELDPSFAAARGSLGWVLLNYGRTAEGRAELDRAAEHEERLSKREALELTIEHHALREEYVDAISELEALIPLRPFDAHIQTNLAEAYLQVGDVERALAIGRKAAEEHAGWIAAQSNLPMFYVIDGDPERGASEAARVRAATARPRFTALVFEGAADTLLGRRAEAVAIQRELEATEPSIAASAEADLALFEGRLTDAVTILLAAIAADDAQNATAAAASKRAMLAEARLRQGDRRGAIEAAARAAESEELATLLRAARVLAASGRLDDASAIARRMASSPGLRAPVYARAIEGDVLVHRAPKDAVAAFGDPGKVAGAWLARADRGFARFTAGDLEGALADLEACSKQQGVASSVFFDDTVTLRYLSPVRYWLARTKEDLHRPDAAAAYRAFLALEPVAQGDSLVADAQRRLKGLDVPL